MHDKSVQLENELSTLQSELDRICYLLKIADPAGEAAKKRELKAQEPKSKKSDGTSTIKKKPPAEVQKSSEPCAKADNKKPPLETQKISETSVQAVGSTEGEKAVAAAATLGLDKSEPGSDRLEAENVVFAVPKPQWLGAVENRVTDDTQQIPSLPLHEMDESSQFVDYKDRSKILGSSDNAKTSVESKIEFAAPGLIIRKRKQAETSSTNSNDTSQPLTSSTSGEKMAEDAVALLLKHNKGLYANDEEIHEGQERRGPKRVLGPEKPSFLNDEMDYDSWVPPEGKHI